MVCVYVGMLENMVKTNEPDKMWIDDLHKFNRASQLEWFRASLHKCTGERVKHSINQSDKESANRSVSK